MSRKRSASRQITETRRVPRLGENVKCPFCGYPVGITNPIQYCSGCYVEYFFEYDEVDDMDYAVFDPSLKSEKYAWAKAFSKMGGVSFGHKD